MSKLLLALFLALTPTAFASIWYVDGVNGNDGNDCKSSSTACKTIGHAISLASSGDSIMVAAATYTENLTIGLSLKILGAGEATTIIDGGAVGTVVKVASASANVTLAKVTIRNGVARLYPGGGGIYNSGVLTINNSTVSGNFAKGDPALGGGISNYGGTLTIHNSTLSGNTASNGLCNSIQRACLGGGIYNDGGTLTISDSTLTANSSANGGGIWSSAGVQVVNNSTISGNTATYAGGGIGILSASGTAQISNSTLSGNSVGTGGSGGALANSSASPANVVLQNSIVANTPSGGNCSGPVTSNGYNLSSDGSCSFTGPGDLNNTDPKLGPLQKNGGPTQTMALLPGSPSIDSGNPSGCRDGNGNLLTTDQRGRPRPDKEDTGGCDMGAYERQSD